MLSGIILNSVAPRNMTRLHMQKGVVKEITNLNLVLYMHIILQWIA